ncbi:MAG: helix-turn-helix domain-containing protein [Bacteroidia bacterium]|nr:helix-turn-helix domain-containing protein [Bacteroidia bacterium]
MSEIFSIKSISEFHELLGLPLPEHPLISLIHDEMLMNHDNIRDELFNVKYTSELYYIVFKDKVRGSFGYGRSTYDFQEGTLIFSSPRQVLTSPSKEMENGVNGWALLFHPDLIRESSLGEKMDNYTFFSYDVNEALHLSPKEEKFILELVLKIKEEYSQNIDQHSQTLIVSNIELLLNYCVRFYDRQFYTRTNINKNFVSDFESALIAYFNSSKLEEEGLPSTNYFGHKLNMSTNYLSDMLKKETGKSIKEHIDGFMVEKAKLFLLNSDKKISEIAYDFGFEYPQSFTRIFKNKTGMSPVEYRKSK